MREGYELRFSNGEIVYWCHYFAGRCDIYYGMVDTQFSDGVYINLLSPKDCRTVEGVSIKEWQSDGRKRKLPKNWSYDTVLFEYGYTSNWAENDIVFLNDYLKNMDITNPNCILEAYNKGYLVKSEDNCHGHIEAKIDKGTWELGWSYGSFGKENTYRSLFPLKYDIGVDYVTVPSPYVYKTYAKALAEKQKHDAEVERVLKLSDLEWSIEQIDKTLNHWAAFRGVSDKKKEAYRKWLLSLSDLENVETRTSMGNIQWKYVKNKRWANIELPDAWKYD